jgi:hypothetical protein
MNPHPGFWHRTRRRPSFWLGVFVACFLAWAWWDSYTNNAALGYTWRARSFVVFRGNGTSFITSAANVWFGPGLDWGYGATTGDAKSALAAWREGGAAVRFCRIPDSLVFFSFVGVWVGWLALSDWRRKSRGALAQR